MFEPSIPSWFGDVGSSVGRDTVEEAVHLEKAWVIIACPAFWVLIQGDQPSSFSSLHAFLASVDSTPEEL